MAETHDTGRLAEELRALVSDAEAVTVAAGLALLLGLVLGRR